MPEVKFPHERKVLGWWLSLYKASTDTMAYYIGGETELLKMLCFYTIVFTYTSLQA